MQTKHLCVLIHTSKLRARLVHRQTGLSHAVKHFTDRSKAVLLLWIVYVISVLFFIFSGTSIC